MKSGLTVTKKRKGPRTRSQTRGRKIKFVELKFANKKVKKHNHSVKPNIKQIEHDLVPKDYGIIAWLNSFIKQVTPAEYKKGDIFFENKYIL